MPKHLKRGPSVCSHVTPAEDSTAMSYHPVRNISPGPVCSFYGTHGRVTLHQRTLHQSSLVASRLHFTENEGHICQPYPDHRSQHQHTVQHAPHSATAPDLHDACTVDVLRSKKLLRKRVVTLAHGSVAVISVHCARSGVAELRQSSCVAELKNCQPEHSCFDPAP